MIIKAVYSRTVAENRNRMNKRSLLADSKQADLVRQWATEIEDGLWRVFEELIHQWSTMYSGEQADTASHFTSTEFGDYLGSKGIKAIPSPSGSSKSSEIFERSKCLHEMVGEKNFGSPA